MNPAPVKLSMKHLAARTRTLLEECASGLSSAYSVTKTETGSLVFELPADDFPHVTSDLHAAMSAALAAGTDSVEFVPDAEPDPGLPVYPD